MNRFRTEAARENLLRRMRRQRLKYITVLPSLVTLLNGLCGFAAIGFASHQIGPDAHPFAYHRLIVPYFAMAGYMILIAMIADMLDGRLARMSKNTSSFGGQLDSLCDVISFGVAPAFLMFKILDFKLTALAESNVILAGFIERFVWLAAGTYICCAAIRLARFNVENEEDESSHMSFVGLPSPAAAGVVASLVILHQETLVDFYDKSGDAYLLVLQDVTLYAMPAIVLGLSVLMVSRIRYPHILNQYIRGKKPFAHFIRALLFFGLVIWSWQLALVLLFCSFAASGVVKWLYQVIRRKSEPVLNPLPLE